jgi:hypothetical protein
VSFGYHIFFDTFTVGDPYGVILYIVNEQHFTSNVSKSSKRKSTSRREKRTRSNMDQLRVASNQSISGFGYYSNKDLDLILHPDKR